MAYIKDALASSFSHLTRSTAGAALVGALMAGLVSAVIAKFIGPNSQSVIVLLAVALAGGIAILTPVHALPTAALIAYLFIPQQFIGFVRGAAPAAVLLSIWAIRRISTNSDPPGKAVWLMRLGAASIVLWGTTLLLTSEDASLHQESARWLLAFALSVFVPLLAVDTSAEARLLWRVLPIVTIALACYMAAEFVLHANPIYDAIYDVVARPVDQQWSVYRSHGPFGHPLYAATFFATSAAAALGRQVAHGRGSYLWFLAGCVGLLSTVSRGALLALAVAAAVILLMTALNGDRRGSLMPVYGQLAIGAALLAASGFVQIRSASSEANSSIAARSNIFVNAVNAAQQTGWRGSGAGTSDQVFISMTSNKIPIESSPLQVAVSLGLVGLVGFGLIILGSVSAAIRGRNIAMLGALTAFFIAISGYNGIDSVLPLMAFLGILLILARSPKSRLSSSLSYQASSLKSRGTTARPLS